MWGSGAVSRGAVGWVILPFALLAAALLLMAPLASAQTPAAEDQYVAGPPVEPETPATPPNPGHPLGGTVCPGQMSKAECPGSGNEGEHGGGGTSPNGGGGNGGEPISNPATVPSAGEPSATGGGGGPTLAFTGYPLSDLVLVMLGLLTAAGLIRGGLALRGRLRTADPS